MSKVCMAPRSGPSPYSPPAAPEPATTAVEFHYAPDREHNRISVRRPLSGKFLWLCTVCARMAIELGMTGRVEDDQAPLFVSCAERRTTTNHGWSISGAAGPS